jgi:hypothetical protein
VLQFRRRVGLAEVANPRPNQGLVHLCAQQSVDILRSVPLSGGWNGWNFGNLFPWCVFATICQEAVFMLFVVLMLLQE